MNGHTPAPWLAQEMPSGCNDRITADDGEGRTICEFPYGLDANACFIVRAVNAHDDLVAALREVLGRYLDVREAAGLDRNSFVADRARAALAKAGAA